MREWGIMGTLGHSQEMNARDASDATGANADKADKKTACAAKLHTLRGRVLFCLAVGAWGIAPPYKRTANAEMTQ